jgi:hypothetical protein
MFSWNRLVNLTDAELAAHDIAAVNLACAADLPGTEGLDVESCRATLDSWAEHVGRETARCADQFRGHPEEFENSWAYFRVLVLATVLQEDYGVRYDPELIQRDDFFGRSENLFIHGVVQGKGGTCSSLPPVYVVVGRRLGYPLKLVQTNSHLFARWHDPAAGERFNVECTARGLNCHTDEYYRNWPLPTEPAEVARCGWLTSQTPREELAGFLANRGHCWLDNRQFRGAAVAYAWAVSLAPRHGGYSTCLAAALDRWREQLRQAVPPRFPEVIIHRPPRRFPELKPVLEEEIVHLEVMEDLLENPVHRREWWEPLRRAGHIRPPQVPKQITIRDPAALHASRCC